MFLLGGHHGQPSRLSPTVAFLRSSSGVHVPVPFRGHREVWAPQRHSSGSGGKPWFLWRNPWNNHEKPLNIHGSHGGVQLVMRVPQARWLVYVMENHVGGMVRYGVYNVGYDKK